jgi:hypothetical protein
MGPPNLNQHLRGIYQVFKARCDLINRSIGHSGTHGAENERAVRDLLVSCLPKQYVISSGMIIDTQGKSSKQIDIAIMDGVRPNFALSDDSRILLADQVVAAIEVKTTYTVGALDEAIENIRHVKRLKPVDRQWGSQRHDRSGSSFMIHKNRPPLGIVFFFNSDAPAGPYELDVVIEAIKKRLEVVPTDEHPDMICSLSHGILACYHDLGHSAESWRIYCSVVLKGGTTDLLELESSHPIRGCVNFGDGELGVDPPIGQIASSTGRSALVLIGGKRLNLQPQCYAACRLKGILYFVDEYRALIQFLGMAENFVRSKPVCPSWTLSDYFGEAFMTCWRDPPNAPDISPPGSKATKDMQREQTPDAGPIHAPPTPEV